MAQEQVVGVAIIRGHKILLVQSEDGLWTLPDGKVEPKETPRVCAARELREELTTTNFHLGRVVGRFPFTTPRSQRVKQFHLFMGTVTGQPKPAAEIIGFQWVECPEQLEEISDATLQAIDLLRQKHCF